eukprot:g31563.t2
MCRPGVYTHAANIQKILVYGQAQYVINFTEGPSKEDVESHWKSNGKATEEDIPSFVARLAPQPAKEKSWRRLFEKIVEVERVFLPVNFFACLVPNLHRSEKVLLAEIFRLRECEAIRSFNWTTVKYTQLFDLAIQALTSLLALLCISTLRDEAPEWCGSLTIFAGLGLPLSQVIGNEIRKAWDMYLEILLHLATLVLFSVFLSKGQVTCSDRGVIDNLWMRAFIIVVSSLRLMCCCDMLRLAYSEVNMIVTPIVSALAKSLPSGPERGFERQKRAETQKVWAAVSRQSKVVAAFAQLGDLQERSDRQQALATKAVEVDKQWFMIGVTNMILSSLDPMLLSTYPSGTVFMCANGPLAWSVLAFNHAMIFHSYAHMTSVVVHVSPLLLSYGLRWYAAPMSESSMGAKHFLVCDGDAESCLNVSFQDLLCGTLVRFYLWWLVLYYIWIFVALGSYIERHAYQTLWDRILVMKPVGPFLQKLLKSWPKLLVQLVYLLVHLVFSAGTMCVAVVLNAAEFYFDVIGSKYEEAAANAKVPVSKKILNSVAHGRQRCDGLLVALFLSTCWLRFCIAVIYFAFIMWQAYWTLDVEEWQNGWKAVIIAWRFAILGDFEVDELEGQEGTWHQASLDWCG